MRLTDTIWIRTTPERVFGFFDNLDATFMGWHNNHHLFRWEEGRGMREGVVLYFEELLGSGIDVITSGNHIFKHKEIEEYLDLNHRIIRPANCRIRLSRRTTRWIS